MFLERTEYPLESLLHSTATVVICQLDHGALKDAIISLLNSGYRHLVLQDATDSLWLLAAIGGRHEGNLMEWYKKQNRPFYIKRSGQHFEMPTANSIRFADGRLLEIRSILSRPGNMRCWMLTLEKTLPEDCIKI
jgi:hypothetical protein